MQAILQSVREEAVPFLQQADRERITGTLFLVAELYLAQEIRMYRHQQRQPIMFGQEMELVSVQVVRA